MSKLNDLAVALGGGLGTATTSFVNEQEAIRLRAQQEADRRRAIAKDNFAVAQSLAPGLIASNPEAASHTLTAVMQQMKDAGYDVNVPNIVGGARQIQRPDANPTQGPLSVTPQAKPIGLNLPQSHTVNAVLGKRLDDAPTDYASIMTQGLSAGPSIGSMQPVAPESVTVRDFSNPQTVAALTTGFGLTQAPKGEWVPVGGALFNTATKEWKTPPTQLTAEDKKAAMADKVKQAYDLAKDKREFDLKMKELGINAQTALALLRIANGGKSSGGKRGSFDPADPNDVATLEGKLLSQAKGMVSVPYPKDEVDRKGRNKPDGFADGMDSVPIADARNAWNQSVQNLYQSLRAKHGLKAETN